jgi:hypothetical protein
MLIFLTVVSVIIILGIVSLQEDSAKNELKALLLGKGFQDIQIKTRWFSGGQGTLTFDVEYRDTQGELQKNSCVTQTSAFSDQKFYWEKPLE